MPNHKEFCFPTYHTLETWGTNPRLLNDKNLLLETLKNLTDHPEDEFSLPTSTLLPYKFDPDGLTGIGLDNLGGIFTGHHWPEPEYNHYAIYTAFTCNLRIVDRLARLIIKNYHPTIVQNRRPLIHHLIAVLEVRPDLLTDPARLWDKGMAIAHQAELKTFEQQPTFSEDSHGVRAVIGLEASHLSLAVRKFDGRQVRMYIDALTCDGEGSLVKLPSAIHQTIEHYGFRDREVKYNDNQILEPSYKIRIEESEVLVSKVRLWL